MCTQLIGISIEIVLIAGYWANLIPVGLLVYGHCMFCVSIWVWLAKLICDSPASRYTHFVVFLSSIIFAGVWAIFAPIFIANEFWKPYNFCDTTLPCLAINSSVILIAGIIFYLQIVYGIGLIGEHYLDSLGCGCKHCAKTPT